MPPAVAVDPSHNLEPGDEVVVRGAGFEPGAYLGVSLCASPAADPSITLNCYGSGGDDRIDDDGGFAILFQIPDPEDYDDGEATATTACSTEGTCTSASMPRDTFCDGVQIVCTVRVEAYLDSMVALGPPQFPPAPVPVTLRT
jgi:hypothetical protein